MILLGNPNTPTAPGALETEPHLIHERFPFITIGIVKRTDDPEQLGRLQVFCPSIDNQEASPESLPWARYVSPFGGEIRDIMVGPEAKKIEGVSTYGFWAIPKVGSQVLVFFIDGDINQRCWFAQVHPLRLGYGLPHFMNRNSAGTLGRWTEDERPNAVDMQSSLSTGLALGDWFITRGPYERQAAATLSQQKNQRFGEDGYAKNPNNPGLLDPQTYCWTTPGQHFFLMSDAPDWCRVRVRSTMGHQIILDDTNERVYISTDTGDSYIEIDSNGLIFIYSKDSISFRTEADLNITADRSINLKSPNINLHADNKTQIHGGCCVSVHSPGDVNTFGGKNVHVRSGDSTRLTAGSTLNLLSGSATKLTASQIHLNGEPAAPADTATIADKPSIVPAREPWIRPLGKKARNKFWRP